MTALALSLLILTTAAAPSEQLLAQRRAPPQERTRTGFDDATVSSELNRSDEPQRVLIRARTCVGDVCTTRTATSWAVTSQVIIIRELAFGPGWLAIDAWERDGLHRRFYARASSELSMVLDVTLHSSRVQSATVTWHDATRAVEVISQRLNCEHHAGCPAPPPQTVVSRWNGGRLIELRRDPERCGCD